MPSLPQYQRSDDELWFLFGRLENIICNSFGFAKRFTTKVLGGGEETLVGFERMGNRREVSGFPVRGKRTFT
jgi:hypothetical protein